MEHVAIYCRLSKEDGDDTESNSIKTQKLIIENYCKRNGWAIYDTYVDDGYSGMNYDRPGFQRMHQDIIDAKVNVVITKDLSRLGRNYILTGYYYQVFFPEAGVRYIAVNDHVDTKNENNDMAMAAFKNIMNDLHSKNLSKNITAAKITRKENKLNCNNVAPYGYRFNDEHNMLIIDPNLAPTVRFIFDEYIKIPNLSRVTRLLNERGITSPCSRLENHRLHRGTDMNWHQTSIISILTNPTYMGALSAQKGRRISPYSKKRVNIPLAQQTIFYDCHEPIVSRDIWEKANYIRAEMSKQSSERTYVSIFTGLLFCAHCGHALCYGGANHSKKTCYCNCWPIISKNIPRTLQIPTLTNFLLSNIQRIAKHCEQDEVGVMKQLVAYFDTENHQLDAGYAVQLENIQNRINNYTEKISLLDSYCETNRYISLEQKLTIQSSLESSLKSEITRFEELKERQKTKPSYEEIMKFIYAARRYGYIKEIDRIVLDSLVEKIYISRKIDDSQWQAVRIKVKYKYIGIIDLTF